MSDQGINLVGHLTSNLGLGVAARNTAALLDSMGTPWAGVDVPTTLKFTNRVATYDDRLWTASRPAPYAANLFHLNPPEAKRQVQSRPEWLAVNGRVNAIVPFWELSKFPPSWADIVRRMDLVLAPTQFVADLSFDAGVAREKVLVFPQTVEIPPDVSADRARWGFAGDEVVFVASFDLNSDLSRKNPAGTIAAFNTMLAQAPQSAGRARLVIKVNNADGEEPRRRLRELRDLAEGPVEIRSEALPYADVLSLYSSADVYVSLHRAEGLGLGLLEAMMLGTPVIATAYSGNLDFMSPADSRLVKYRLVPVAGTSIGSYDPRSIGDGQMWAEPDVDDAARAMLELMNASRRAELGQAALNAAIATRDDSRRRLAIERVLDEIAKAPTTSALSELQTLPGWVWRARSLAGSVRRRLRK